MRLNIQNYSLLISNDKQKYDINVGFSFDKILLKNSNQFLSNISLNNFIKMNKSGTIVISNGQIICSLGEEKEFNLDYYLNSLKLLITFVRNQNINKINLILEDTLAKDLNLSIDEYYEKTVFYILNFFYNFDEQKTKKVKLDLENINFITTNSIEKEIKNAISMTESLFLLKHLANNPANLVTPSYVANKVSEFGKLSNKVKIKVLDKKEIKKEKMNSFLAVAQGSDEEPKFIILEYFANKKDVKPIVLIGKGITFDSGGISLKPSANMDAMKYDMCGAATVISLFEASVKLNLAINLVVLVPLCENMPSGKALKPGDVIETMSGQTVEVLNTDAEGRLILCDTLTYAKRYEPDLVIDMATLTGGCIIALANVASAIYGNNQEVVDNLIKYGNKSGDFVWQMPLFKEYHQMLESKTADIANIAGWKGHASSPTAACFLEKFVDYKWVHLDIAGVADGESKFNSVGYSGATGRPFYMLIDYLKHY
jgi:leucyl aminopeptidase